ncbi:MAG: cytochrome c [Magnetospirillum sp.]|nr:cytochrome c [Magnetospirillum sp.]
MKRFLLTTAVALLLAAPARAEGDAAVDAGRAVAIASDCIACHTVPGGKPFAGGLPMQTPIGTIYSTNITPASRTGIGGYSYDDFARALRDGIAKDGHNLYPAMPYPSYAKLTEADMKALYAYFMNGVEGVEQPNRPSDIPWPLSMRWPLALWNKVFVSSAPFQPVTGRDAQWNRGAYLVEGPGHCGSCHTPRGIGYQEKALGFADGEAFLAGGRIDGWFAKSLRSDKGFGLGDWSEADIVTLLKTGRTDRTAAFGGMVEVIGHSTQHMPAEDLAAIARYLKSLPPRPGKAYAAKAADTTFADLRKGDYGKRGAVTYVEYCQGCHRADGMGAPKIFPALAGNSAVVPTDDSSLIRIVLAGGRMPVTENGIHHAFAMPGFARLSDGEITDVVTFIRRLVGQRRPAGGSSGRGQGPQDPAPTRRPSLRSRP